MSATGAVWRWELLKVWHDPATRILLIVCGLAPWLFLVALIVQPQEPKDTLFGLYVHTSGWAIPLVTLAFFGTWLVPLVVAVLSCSLFAGEDQAGGWACLLSRGRSLEQVFFGKSLTGLTTVAATFGVLAASSIVAGLVYGGAGPIIGLSGAQLSGTHLAVAVVESWVLGIPPALALAGIAIFISSVTRQTLTALFVFLAVGLVMQLDQFVNAGSTVRELLPTTYLGSWHSLFTSPAGLHQFLTGLLVAAVWLTLTQGLSLIIFRRREFGS